MIRWREKAEQHDVVEYYRGLIELRRAHPLFRLETADEARGALKFLDDQLGLPVPEGCVGFLIEDGAGRDEWSRALVLLNPQAKAVEFAIPEGEWRIFGDARRAGNSELRQSAARLGAGRASVTARSALILGELRGKTDDSFGYNLGDHQIEETKTR
jgi:pullulanase